MFCVSVKLIAVTLNEFACNIVDLFACNFNAKINVFSLNVNSFRVLPRFLFVLPPFPLLHAAFMYIQFTISIFGVSLNSN